MSSKGIFRSFLNTYKSFIITAHANPDPDALGSAVAVYRYLELLGKKALLVLDAKIPANLKFLLNDIDITSYLSFANNNKHFEATIALDCSNKARTYTAEDHIIWSMPVMNIDHHPDNTMFGDINIVNKQASATGEILFDLFYENEQSLNHNIAQAIYVALIGDTGGFRYGNTSAKVLNIAAKLLDYQLDVAFLNMQVLEKQSRKAFNLISDCLSTVEFYDNVATMYVPYNMLQKHNIDASQLPELVNYIRSIEAVEIAILFLEVEKDFTKISFRSQPHIDISKVAKIFNGGGHKNAAGCKLAGNLDKTIKTVIKAVKNYLNRTEAK
ncbi:bifunctional oligoribonuclease/PAP phosphatase NrnA [Clostridium sp. 'deep sea']|uniref:DHH family phosphoesterase n=1 Tax=Clostridium sp. 'deep sea' TaxID=2779445 RepID=UPI0018966DD3|nr:bifunctional oligoribonuclease/PAP phosphatase NrnA [Clostridium sp. 'deep sea']QOR36017.1 bifunctional oligoribonuclease/PAP phosphatase NrnA [Clostridium sp. 'deep sea']